jgi:hypothetical protein
VEGKNIMVRDVTSNGALYFEFNILGMLLTYGL